MTFVSGRAALWIVWALLVAPATAQTRVVESIVPSLVYNSSCSSVVELRNLSDRRIAVDVLGHRSSGALVPLNVSAAINIWMEPGAAKTFRLRIDEDAGAWVKVRERVAAPDLSPAIAISGATECVAGDQLRTVTRDVAWPVRNPWFSGDAADLQSGILLLINTSEQPVNALACWSSGSFYSRPEQNRTETKLRPVCSYSLEVQIPPFGSREFPVDHEGSRWFSLKTAGNSIVLEALRPVDAKVRLYAVDSTITFGSELP